MSRFKGRVAIVTGAASGIGKQIAIRIAAEGGIPVIADLNLDAANATAKEIAGKGGDAFAVAMNVVDEAQGMVEARRGARDHQVRVVTQTEGQGVDEHLVVVHEDDADRRRHAHRLPCRTRWR